MNIKVIRVKFKYPHLEPESKVFRVAEEDLEVLDNYDRDSLVELLVDLGEMDEIDSDFAKSAEVLPIDFK